MSTTVDTVEIPSFPWVPFCFRTGCCPSSFFEARYLDMAARCMRATPRSGCA
jgi:Lon protease-like protein